MRSGSASGNTNLWDAASAVIKDLSNATGGNKVAVVFTDGLDNESSSGPRDVIAQANAAGVRVFMIGLGDPQSIDVPDMTDVATDTSGFYAAVGDSSKLTLLFNNAFNDSKASGCISLTFSPPPPSGQTVTGGLSFKVNNAPFQSPYQVTF